jgi:hypothetical protein
MDLTSKHAPRMRTCLWAALFSLAFQVHAQSSGFGLGIMLGNPTGISMKGWTGPKTAIDGALAWNFWNSSYLHLHADYLFHNMELIHVAKGKLPLYYGPGLRIESWNGDGRWHHRGHWHDLEASRMDLAFRFPVGLDYLPEATPLDVFLEIVPTLELVPASWLEFDGGIGVRYWF